MTRVGQHRRQQSGREVALLLSLLCLLPASRADAFDLGPDGNSVEVHAFGSQGFFVTTGNDFIAADSTSGSFAFTEAGINFNKDLTDSLRLGMQFFAQNLGRRGDFAARIDWMNIDWRYRDWLGFRAGRMKIPYGLYNEFQDVDAGRVPVLLPQSVYPLLIREILYAQNGAEVYGFVDVGAFGALEYQLFGGTIFVDGDSLVPLGSPVEIDLRVPRVFGGRLIWETPLEGLRLAGSIESVRLEPTAFVTFPGQTPIKLLIDNDSLQWVASAEYRHRALIATVEYSRWKADQTSSNPALSPPLKGTSERAYAMLTYRLNDWLHPGAYYALYHPDVDNHEGRENKQHDVAATMRFDINHNWLVKLEAHYFAGTAGLRDPVVIDPVDISTAEEHWGAVFVRTTAYF